MDSAKRVLNFEASTCVGRLAATSFYLDVQGMRIAERQDVRRRVEQLGGTMASFLDKSVTYLITQQDASGSKKPAASAVPATRVCTRAQQMLSSSRAASNKPANNPSSTLVKQARALGVSVQPITKFLSWLRKQEEAEAPHSCEMCRVVFHPSHHNCHTADAASNGPAAKSLLSRSPVKIEPSSPNKATSTSPQKPSSVEQQVIDRYCSSSEQARIAKSPYRTPAKYPWTNVVESEGASGTTKVDSSEEDSKRRQGHFKPVSPFKLVFGNSSEDISRVKRLTLNNTRTVMVRDKSVAVSRSTRTCPDSAKLIDIPHFETNRFKELQSRTVFTRSSRIVPMKRARRGKTLSSLRRSSRALGKCLGRQIFLAPFTIVEASDKQC